jgi:hypothetical protein
MSRYLFFPLLGLALLGAPNPPIAPVPADPHELVTGGAIVASTPAARAAALAMFERAKQNADLHMPGTPPFFLKATVTTSSAGPGELTETWMSGQAWRWTASLGEYSQTRLGLHGALMDAQPVSAIPMRVQTLRSAIFWSMRQVSNATLRTAAVEWNGRPATCILDSRSLDPAIGARQWVEEEYCIDNATGLLQIQSPAPGSFIVYGYSKNMQFHERAVPDRITAYIAGAVVIDAQIEMSDAGTPDESQFTPTKEMLQNDSAVVLNVGRRFPTDVPGPAGSTMVLPVMVHITIGAAGTVLEAEVSAAAEPLLGQVALDKVRSMGFGEGNTQQETYVNVSFVPPLAQTNAR